MRTAERWETLKSAFWVALVPGALLFAWMQLQGYLGLGMLGADAHAYWLAARDPSSWYTRQPGTWDAYLYSPAFAQALWPIAQLPWRAFQGLWLCAELVVAVWLLAPLGWRRTVVLLPLLVGELALGNVYLFFGAALVAAVTRAPGAMVLPLLTKVVPGVVGLWYVVRGEWRAVGWVAVTTASVVGVSALASPAAWVRWVEFLGESTDSGRGHSTMVRVVAAAVVVVFAARTNRSWLLAPALILACPVLGGWNYLAALAALPRLLGRDRSARLASASGERLEENEAAVPSHLSPAPAALQSTH